MLDIVKKDRVAVMRLNRPDRRNALGIEMIGKVNAALDEIEFDATVGAVMVEGAEPGFCAGSDLKELAGMDVSHMGSHEKSTAAISRRLSSFPKPVIAAIDGFAIGGGFLFAAAADVIVTSRNARWHLPEVALGWIPPWGLSALIRRVGMSKAKQLAWGAEPIDGNEAYRIGLADMLTDAKSSTPAFALATQMAALPPQAVRSAKLFFNSMAMHGNDQPLDDLATTLFQSNCQTDEAIATFNRLAQSKKDR